MTHPSRAAPVRTYGPAPAGHRLTVAIECTADVLERTGALHRIVIQPDWTVEAPHHDLDAERVARAFGGWCTCLHVAEHIVPAYRRALGAMLDPGRLRLGGEHRGSALSGEDEFDCMPDDDPWEAGRALRAAMGREISAEHQLRGAGDDLATQPLARAERIMYDRLMQAAGAVWTAWGDPAHLDGGADAYADLWRAGIPPTAVERVARSVTRAAWPLPVEFYDRVHFDDIDPVWLINVLNCYPDRDFALWAAAQDGCWGSHPAEDVWRMYVLGIGARDAIGALEARVPIATLSALAARPGVGGTTAARWLTIWARVGVTPTPAHYRVLDTHRVLVDRPALWLLDWTVDALRRFGADAPSRTELAVMLALTSDVAVIERAVASGIRSAVDPRFARLITTRRARPR